MRITTVVSASALALLVVLLTNHFTTASPEAQADSPPSSEKRTLWTTSHVKGTPDPPPPYRTEPAFANLKFEEPLDITSAPGTDRLFVVERYGRVLSIPNDPQADRAEVLLDLNKTLYGAAFHPNFAQNGYFYVTYVLDPEKEEPLGTRVSRFQAKGSPRKADLGSEKILIEWASGGHNGGCLKFGPDGYLYIATGDSSGIADEYLTGQDLSKLPGSILRIDVDHTSHGKAYGVPEDNPFVGVDGARPEIYAYGLRQPWKMSFDTQTGDLWTGNVGQDLWEMIFRIKKGGNYGWSITEGSHPFRPERPHGPTPIEQPIVEHDHADFRSITGGYVYHGTRLPELAGAYIYGDYDTGKIWMLRYDRQREKVTERSELVDSALRLVGFAEDHQGELFLLDHMGGQIHRLVPNPASTNPSDFPRKLSATGLFASVKDLTPAPGLIPFTVNAPSWSDGATKQWYLALPGDSQIEFEAITYPQPAPGAPAGWKFPDGSVLVETLLLEMEEGNPGSRRRLETRILHHERLTGSEAVGDQYWQGYTYVWNDQQTEATLLEDPQGSDRTFAIADADAPGGKRQQTWHFPSRAECTVCHNMAAKYVLGATTLQLNKDHDYGTVVENQLSHLNRLGVFTEPLAKAPDEYPRLVDFHDATQDLGRRARSYLHANCSHCHRKWGGGNAEFQFLATLDLADTGAVGVRPGQGTFRIADAAVLAAGDPYRSIAFYRMAKLGSGRMPRIGSAVVDRNGLNLIHDWLAHLPPQSSDGQASESLTRAKAQIGAALDGLAAAQSAEARSKQIEQLLATTRGAVRLLRAVDESALPAEVAQQAVAAGIAHDQPQIRDLFERFLPEEKRTKRLGSVIKPEQILALSGDAARGKKLFFDTEGIRCKTCHRIGEQGTEVGPDLNEIGKKYDRAKILENILEPSRIIEEKYRVHLVETVQGQIYSGLLVKQGEDEVVLKDAENKLIRVSADEIERLSPQQQSLMPDLQLRDLTAPQVADLIEYLSSLK